MGKDVVSQVRRCLGHAPGGAGGANTTALARERNQEVMPTVITAGAGEAVGKDAALEVFAKSLFHMGRRGVVVALPVELARAGQRQPGLDSQPWRSASVSGVSAAISSTLRGECNSSPSTKWICSASASPRPTVLLPQPLTPMTTIR